MYTNYEFTRALVIDHQQQMREHARVHRLGFVGRRARRAQAKSAAGEVASTVHYLPSRVRQADVGETRAAS